MKRVISYTEEETREYQDRTTLQLIRMGTSSAQSRSAHMPSRFFRQSHLVCDITQNTTWEIFLHCTVNTLMTVA